MTDGRRQVGRSKSLAVFLDVMTRFTGDSVQQEPLHRITPLKSQWDSESFAVPNLTFAGERRCLTSLKSFKSTFHTLPWREMIKTKLDLCLG